MLIHPFNEKDRGRLETFSGTRLLKDSLGVVGARIQDPDDQDRCWHAQAVYAPVPERRLGGVRTKFTDQYGFTTFCNQRDLEVLLKLGTPGRYCPWGTGEYTEPGERGWYGFCLDDEDLLDDLYDREAVLRQSSPSPVLPRGSSITRRLYYGGSLLKSTHRDAPNYAEEWDLLWDMDPETGECPDTRLATLARRWSRVARDRVRWCQDY